MTKAYPTYTARRLLSSGPSLALPFDLEPGSTCGTFFQVPSDTLDRFASIYKRPGNKLSNIDKEEKGTFITPPKCYAGGGGLLSTAQDDMTFLQMIANHGEHQGKRLLKAETVDLMTTRQSPVDAGPVTFGNDEPRNQKARPSHLLSS